MTKEKAPGWIGNGQFNVNRAALYLFQEMKVHPDDPDVMETIRQHYPDLPSHLHPLIRESMVKMWRWYEFGEDLNGPDHSET